MTFVDTNYFLRLLRDDVPEQTKVVKQFFQRAARRREQLVTSAIVLFEINWVLSSIYKASRESVNDSLRRVLALQSLRVEDHDVWRVALIFHRQRPTFSLEDCYNLTYGKSRDVSDFRTFDKKLARAFYATK